MKIKSLTGAPLFGAMFGPQSGVTLTMTSPLLLSGNPVNPAQAATKQYVDSLTNNIPASKVTSSLLAVGRFGAWSSQDATKAAASTFIELTNTGVSQGTYPVSTVDVNGRVTQGGNLLESHIPVLPWNKFTSGKPTTTDGYGIADALQKSGGVLTDSLELAGVSTNALHAINKGEVDQKFTGVGGLATGDIAKSYSDTTPNGFLRCNGAQVSKTTYSALFAVIGGSFSDTYIGNGQPWRQQYNINTEQSNDITGWELSGSSLPTPLSHSHAAVTKNRVYLLGGRKTGSTISSDIYSAPINSDGTLGAWVTETALPRAISGGQLVITNNYAYLIGGNQSTNPVTTIHRALIEADGSFGAWVLSSPLPIGLRYFQAIVIKNRIYVLGGQINRGNSASVYTTEINADGTLGTWSETSSLPASVYSSQAIVTKNRVYLLGATTGSVGSSVVYTAPINADDTLGTWTTALSLPGAVGESQAIVTKNRVYLLGGNNNSLLSVVYTAPINADGTLGDWTTGTSLFSVSGYSQAVVTKNRVHLLGGLGSDRLATSAVYTAPISGGVNDYSMYYDGTFLTASNYFSLPNYSDKEATGIYSYIKT